MKTYFGCDFKDVCLTPERVIKARIAPTAVVEAYYRGAIRRFFEKDSRMLSLVNNTLGTAIGLSDYRIVYMQPGDRYIQPEIVEGDLVFTIYTLPIDTAY